MRLYKMFSNTAAVPTEDELYQSATALQPVPPHPTPLKPHIGDFSERVYVLVCEKRRGYA